MDFLPEITKALADINIYPIIATFAAMLLDMITGFAKGLKNFKIQSSVMRAGLWHKFGFIALIASAVLLIACAKIVELPFEVPLLEATCVFIILTEAVSIFENACELNPAIAYSPLGKVLAQNPRQNLDLYDHPEGAPEDFEAVHYANN